MITLFNCTNFNQNKKDHLYKMLSCERINIIEPDIQLQSELLQIISEQICRIIAITIIPMQDNKYYFINFNYQFVYPKKHQFIIHMQLSSQQMVEQDSTPDYEVCYDPTNADTLVFLKHPDEFISKFSSEDVLPNFIVLPDAKKSNIHKLSLKAMVQQPVASQLMINKFCELARQCYDKKAKEQQQINKFQKLMLTDLDPLSQARQLAVLKEYTNSSFFHKILNSLLRLCLNVMELFYCHYFVQLLFKSIKKLYRTYDQGQRKFECYRGATLSEQQMDKFKNSVGKHIEVLGFLSASFDKPTAISFAKNTLIQIIVEDQNMFQQFDYGYAFIEGISYIPNERQVLFNTLNSFEVISVSQQYMGNGIQLKITLKYGSTAKLLTKYRENKEYKLSQAEKQILPMLIYQNCQSPSNRNQALLMNNQYKKTYCQTYVYLTKICQKYSSNALTYTCSTLMSYYSADNLFFKSQKTKQLITYLQKNQQRFNITAQIQLFAMKQAHLNTPQYWIKLVKQNLDQVMNFFISWMQIVIKQMENNNYQKQFIFFCKALVILLNKRRIKYILLGFRDYNVYELKKQFQQLKCQTEQLFGQFHPIYIDLMQMEIQYLTKLNPSQKNYSLQQQLNKENNFYELLKLTCSENFQQQLLHYKQFMVIPLQNYHFQQIVNLYIQYKGKLFASCPPNSNQQKKQIQRELLKPIADKFNNLNSNKEYQRCLILINKIINHVSYFDQQFKKIKNSIKKKQKKQEHDYNSAFLLLVNRLTAATQQVQINSILSLVEECRQTMVIIAKILGQNSELYVKYRQLQQLLKEILLNLQETAKNEQSS